MNPYLIFAFGVIVGFFPGLLLIGLLNMAAQSDREMDALESALPPDATGAPAGYQPGSLSDPRD